MGDAPNSKIKIDKFEERVYKFESKVRRFLLRESIISPTIQKIN